MLRTPYSKDYVRYIGMEFEGFRMTKFIEHLKENVDHEVKQ